jgi:hypothetical protein
MYKDEQQIAGQMKLIDTNMCMQELNKIYFQTVGLLMEFWLGVAAPQMAQAVLGEQVD